MTTLMNDKGEKYLTDHVWNSCWQLAHWCGVTWVTTRYLIEKTTYTVHIQIMKSSDSLDSDTSGSDEAGTTADVVGDARYVDIFLV